VDIDLIKVWITQNTDSMLKHRELQEYIEKQVEQKDKIENEMLEEGDKMTELLIMKEKLEMEKETMEDLPEDEKDEGRILEIEDQMKYIGMEIESITQTLDMLEDTLAFVQSKVNQGYE
jgi:predicted nucleotidyltransferase